MLGPGVVHYLPIATTLLAALLCLALARRYAARGRGAHLLWWAAGMLTYGLGTALESAITLTGNTVLRTKLWYIAGALLGGYPLAQGTVYLLLPRRLADRLTAITLPAIALLAALVALSPVDPKALELHRPSGAVLAWSWIRALTPLVNLYAVTFLVGGAVQSALRYARSPRAGDAARTWGNASIALGGLLPGVGGVLAKTGRVEALYVAELAGLLLIALGFWLNVAAQERASAL